MIAVPKVIPFNAVRNRPTPAPTVLLPPPQPPAPAPALALPCHGERSQVGPNRRSPRTSVSVLVPECLGTYTEVVYVSVIAWKIGKNALLIDSSSAIVVY